MTPTLFTLYLPRENQSDINYEVVARHLSIGDAMLIAIEHSGEWSMTFFHDDFDGFRIFRLRRYGKATFLDDPNMIVVAVPQTEDFLADKATAEEIVGSHFLGCQHMYWEGAITSDQDYAAREASRAISRIANTASFTPAGRATEADTRDVSGQNAHQLTDIKPACNG